MRDPSWLRGDWMQTYTGRAFWPLDPKPEDIHPLDIAHALSMQCRYNGHVRRFYSVAEHCILMSQAVAPEHALWALLHDATEAYVGDLIRPIKHSLPDYIAIENRVMAAICERYGLAERTMPPAVKEADNRILLTERNALMTSPPREWAVSGDPLPVAIRGYDPGVAEARYLIRLFELTGDSL